MKNPGEAALAIAPFSTDAMEGTGNLMAVMDALAAAVIRN